MIYRIPKAEIGLFYRKGVTIVVPSKKSMRKSRAVITDNGTVLIQNRTDDFSVEQILEIYGGKIIEIEIESDALTDKKVMSDSDFPKIKNMKALEKYR